MIYTNINVPFITKDIIKRKADLFRQKFWDDIIPIDIEKIIDVKLKIDIIPVPELERLCDTNALITSDWSFIYVDKNIYEDERRINRLRFSYAHEIGHLILHKDLYSLFNINNFADYYGFFNIISGEEYAKIETQANIFASYLLVPRKMLEFELKNELKKIENFGISREAANPYIADSLGKKFGVSSESMEIVLNEYNK